MANLDPRLADLLEQQLREMNDLSVDDIHRRAQWVWRQIIAAARDLESIEKQLAEVHQALDPMWDEAYERSMLSQDKRLNAKFHESVANNRCREQVSIVAGLEAQKRIASRWWNTLREIHEGLRTHEVTARTLAAA